MNKTLQPILLATLVLFATSANALVIEISENSDFSGSISVDDSSDTLGINNDGVVTLSGSLGAWLVNVVTGLSSQGIGDSTVDTLHLNSVNVSGGVGTLYLRLTDTDFSRNDASFIAAFGGVTDGTVEFQSYVDATNIEFGTGMLLGDSGPLSGNYFSGGSSGSFDMDGPYSMSIYATITHTNNGLQFSSFDYELEVPEPGTLALLGLGLMGLGLTRRRTLATDS